MKILVINDFIAPGSGGAGVAILRTFSNLAKHESIDNITIVGYNSEKQYFNNLRYSKIKFEFLGGLNLPFWSNNEGLIIKQSLKFKSLVLEVKPDFIVLGSPTIACLQVAKVAKKLNIPCAYISQTQPEVLDLYLSPYLGNGISKKISRSLHNLVYKLFSSCELQVFPTKMSINFLSDYSVHKLRKSKIVEISNGIDLDIFKPSLNFESKADTLSSPRILFVGRMMKDKNPEILVNIAVKLKSIFPEFIIDMVGNGPQLKNLIELSKKLDVNNFFHFHKFLDEKDLVVLFQNAHLTIVPSYTETQSLVTLESLSCITPVLCSDSNINAAKSIIKEFNIGMTYKFNDPLDLRDKILEIVNDENRYKSFMNNCLEARNRYDFDNISKIWINNLKQIMTAKDKEMTAYNNV